MVWAVSLVAGQCCMSRTVSVIGQVPRRPGTLHVVICTMLVARYYSLPSASGTGGPADQQLSQSTGSRDYWDSRHKTTLRTRCSYMCFITWTIVVLMSNSNN